MSKYTATDLSETIVALSTPQGVGAIGVIRMSGSAAIEICDEVFYGKKLSEQASHTLHFGTIRDGSIIVDEVVVALFKGPRSYTGENIVEVSFHGSPYILQKGLALLIRYGARLAKPGEFTMRAFLNGRMDLSQAEAVADLIASESEAAHGIAMQQMRGGFSNEITALREQLIHFASMIELELDFGEEDVEFANRADLIGLVQNIQKLIRNLLNSFELGNAIKHGVTTVIAGRPNAGKSTLLNAILNEDRAIVSDIAGTTRDTIEEVINIKGIQFRLIDTAGIRDAQDQIEAIGVQKTMETIRKSTILLYVFDVIALTPEEVAQDLQALQQDGLHILAVANKMDKNPYIEPYDFASEHLATTQIVSTSALNKMNIEHLQNQLYDLALQQQLSKGSTIISNARHYEALEKSNESLDNVLRGIDGGLSGELLAFDIKESLHYLGTISGEVTTEDLLGNIFGKFCIGK